MLVLSRKLNESLVIDHKIVITILDIQGGKIRLGIEAPKEIAVHRAEVEAALATAALAGPRNGHERRAA